MKKKILALLLMITVVMSMAMFVSCNGEEEEDTGIYLEDVNVTVRATAFGNTLFEQAFTMSGYEAELTVGAATLRAVDRLDPVDDVSVATDAVGRILRVGDYEEGGLYVPYDDYDYDEYENGEAAADEDEGYFWFPSMGGRDVSITDRITDGAVIIWDFSTLDD